MESSNFINQWTCFLCRSNVEDHVLTSKQSPEIQVWAKSCAKSLREILNLDESFLDFLATADYCPSCQNIVRDLSFVYESIQCLQNRLNTATSRVQSLLKTNYRTVLKVAAEVDPLGDIKVNPNDIMVKAVGDSLGFESDCKPEIVPYHNPVLVVAHTGPSTSRPVRARKQVMRFRNILPKPAAPGPDDPEQMKMNTSPSSECGSPDPDPMDVHETDTDPDYNPGQNIQKKVTAAPSRRRRLTALRSRQNTTVLVRPSTTKFGGRASKRSYCKAKGCRFTTWYKLKYDVHMRTKHQNDPTPYHCVCGQRFVNIDEFALHNGGGCGAWDPDYKNSAPAPTLRNRLLALRMRQKPTYISTYGKRSVFRIYCKERRCRFTTYYENKLEVHKREKHEDDPTPYHCSCGDRFGSNEDFKVHNDNACLDSKRSKTTRLGVRSASRLYCKVKGCRFSALYQDRIDVHVRAKHQNDPTPFHCSCGQRFGSTYYFSFHKKKTCPDLPPTARRVVPRESHFEKSRTSQLIRCTYKRCRHVTHDPGSYRIHRNLVHGEDLETPYHCTSPGCAERFTSRDLLKAHLSQRICQADDQASRNSRRRLKRQLGLLDCPEERCEYKAHDQERLDFHKKVLHNPNREPASLKCQGCGHKFSSTDTLYVHQTQRCPNGPRTTPKMKTLRTKKKYVPGIQGAYKCVICWKHYESEEDLSSHTELHELRDAAGAEKKFSCVLSQCDKCFISSCDLRIHVRQDHEVTPYKCQLCCVILVNKNSFDRHMRDIHNPKPSLKCPYHDCSYFGKSKPDLRHHNIKHEKKQDIQCLVCGKHYSWPSSLRTHMRIHSNIRPFKCLYAGCEKSFITSEAHRSHEETHSTIRSYLCYLCPKDFKTQKTLNQHLRLSHHIRGTKGKGVKS